MSRDYYGERIDGATGIPVEMITCPGCGNRYRRKSYVCVTGQIMIVNVHFQELYPYYWISETKLGDAEIEMTEEELANWQKVVSDFHHLQNQIQMKIAAYENKKIDLRYLQSVFDKENPSRQDKGSILKRFGWIQTDTSVWQYKGRELRLHEAFEECRQAYESSKKNESKS